MNNESMYPDGRRFAELSARAFDAFDRARCDIARLGDIGNVADDELRKGADQMLRNLSYRAKEARPSKREPARPPTEVNALSAALEPLFVGIHRKLSPRTVETPALLWAWSGTSIGLVATMSWAAHRGQWWLATALAATRVVGSMYAGTARFPSFLRPEPPLEAPSRILRCVMSHTGDALGLVGVGFSLSAAGRPVWGFVLSCSALLLLIATLTRVAAVQVGIVIHRKATERVFRRGSLILGLAAMALSSGDIRTGVPLVMIAAAGPALYAATELWRMASCLLSMRPRSVILDVNVDGRWEQHEMYRDTTFPTRTAEPSMRPAICGRT